MLAEFVSDSQLASRPVARSLVALVAARLAPKPERRRRDPSSVGYGSSALPSIRNAKATIVCRQHDLCRWAPQIVEAKLRCWRGAADSNLVEFTLNSKNFS